MIKLNGCKPSPNDLVYTSLSSDKHSKLVKLAVSNDSEYRIAEFTPISNQGSLNSCVANSVTDSVEILMGLESKSVVQLSRLFVYWNARVYTKDTDKDDGTWIVNAFNSLRRLGVCPEDMWGYDPAMVYTQPPISCYKTANDNTITSYYRIDSKGGQRLDDIESAVRANHPVVFATAVSDEFVGFSGTKTWDPPVSGIPLAGNHAMIVTGVRRSPSLQFYIRNSWGRSWGKDGHTWMSADYLMWNKTFDIWVPTRMDDLIL